MRYIILSLLLTACGADPQQAQDFADAAQNKEPINYQPDEKEIVVEYRKDGGSVSLVVVDTKDLPACSNANIGQLSYVKTQDKFFACSIGGNWNEIDIQGKDGKTGAQGEKGEKGDQGPKGDPGSAAPVNIWTDPVTAKVWMIGAEMNGTSVNALQPCTNGWRIGAIDEVSAAVVHGLILASKAIDGPEAIWTTSHRLDANGNPTDRIGVSATGSQQTGALLTRPGIACIKQ